MLDVHFYVTRKKDNVMVLNCEACPQDENTWDVYPFQYVGGCCIGKSGSGILVLFDEDVENEIACVIMNTEIVYLDKDKYDVEIDREEC